MTNPASDGGVFWACGAYLAGITVAAQIMFWRFFLILFVADFAITFLFAMFHLTIGTLCCGILPLRIGRWLPQLYFWGGWAAFCSELTHMATAGASVTHPWVYWTWAFFASYAPIAWLSQKELQCAETAAEANCTRNIGCLWSFAAVVCFLTFAFWRGGEQVAYGWITEWLKR